MYSYGDWGAGRSGWAGGSWGAGPAGWAARLAGADWAAGQGARWPGLGWARVGLAGLGGPGWSVSRGGGERSHSFGPGFLRSDSGPSILNILNILICNSYIYI